MFGFLAANKPVGVRSRQVVDAVARALDHCKVGHAGTLDPLAHGVLLLALGPATRLIPFTQQPSKTYLAKFMLGVHSDSDDLERPFTHIDGSPIPTREALDAAAQTQIGWIDQIPPRYSAVKVSGRRAYKLARAGREVTLRPRRVRIDSIQVTRYEFPFFELHVCCGSGTYIRSLGRDIATHLGTKCVMTNLCRTAIGEFQLTEATDCLSADPQLLRQKVTSPLSVVRHLPRIECTNDVVESLRLGKALVHPTLLHPTESLSDSVEESTFGHAYAVDSQENLVAVLTPGPKRGHWNPTINFSQYWDRRS